MIVTSLNYSQIRDILPQEYPFVMIDRIEDVRPGEGLTAIKNISADEWPFRDCVSLLHFPETLLIEAAAQAAIVLYHVSMRDADRAGKRYAIGKIKAEFLTAVELRSKTEAASSSSLPGEFRNGAESLPAPFPLMDQKDGPVGGVNIGDEVRVVVSSGKILSTGGFTEAEIFSEERKIANLTLFFAVTHGESRATFTL